MIKKFLMMMSKEIKNLRMAELMAEENRVHLGSPMNTVPEREGA